VRPTPIPDDEVWPSAIRKTIGPPVRSEDISPVEVLIEMDPEHGPVFRVRCEIEPADVERIAAGKRIFWLSWWGEHLHPFGVGMTEDDQVGSG
jgi:hypothetical protein